MTKDEVAKAMYNAMWVEGIPNDKATSVAVIDAFGEVVKAAVAEGQAVTLRGFGTFLPRHYPERSARNFQDNEVVRVPARTLPIFRPSAEFTESVKLGTTQPD